ncbi:MAG: hypothetical protein IPK87_07390 [Planctomycetes bacterium]|nr:hypothetical protein [Planctomycetota bacterium]
MSKPNEKIIRVLADATRDRPARRRSLLITVPLGILLLLVLSILAVEGWRQSRISAAEDRAKQAVADIRADYASIGDWPGWYRGRVKGTRGDAEFRAWVGRASSRHIDEDVSEVLFGLEHRLLGELPEGTQLSSVELRKFVETAAPTATELDEILVFDGVTGVPSFENGLPTIGVLQRISAIKVLCARCLALAGLGQFESAWRDIERLFKLVQRVQDACTLIEYMVNCAIEGLVHATFQQVCAVGAPPDSLGIYFPWPDAPDRLTELVELEAVFAAQMPPNADALAEYFGNDHSRRWFRWFDPTTTPSSWPHEFTREARDLDEFATYVQAVRELAGMHRGNSGTPPVVHDWARDILSKSAAGRARLTVARRGSNLAYDFRTAERKGTPLTECRASKLLYSVRSVEVQNDGAVVWTWDLPQADKVSIAGPYATIEDLRAESLSLKLFPMNR